MTAKQLIGKTAIRIKHTTYAGGCIDRSFTSTPIEIINATDTHIVYKHAKGSVEAKIFKSDEPRILPYEFCDDNWIDYTELLKR